MRGVGLERVEFGAADFFTQGREALSVDGGNALSDCSVASQTGLGARVLQC